MPNLSLTPKELTLLSEILSRIELSLLETLISNSEMKHHPHDWLISKRDTILSLLTYFQTTLREELQNDQNDLKEALECEAGFTKAQNPSKL